MITKDQLGKKIKGLREERQVSQEQLAKIVGISRPALSAIERGGRSIDAFELSKLADFFNIKTDSLLNYQQKMNEERTDKDGINQDIEFKPDKLKQVLLYLLNKCGGKPNVGETVLYKLLYFIDFDSYEILGRPIMGMRYKNRQFGPVPEAGQFTAVVDEMREKNMLKQFQQEYHGYAQKRYIPLADFDLNVFSIQEKKIIDDVIVKLSDMTAKQIEDYAHEDHPWKATVNGESIPYDLVFDRTAPYANIDVEKAWQDAAATDMLKALGPMSEEEIKYYESL